MVDTFGASWAPRPDSGPPSGQGQRQLMREASGLLATWVKADLLRLPTVTTVDAPMAHAFITPMSFATKLPNGASHCPSLCQLDSRPPSDLQLQRAWIESAAEPAHEEGSPQSPEAVLAQLTELMAAGYGEDTLVQLAAGLRLERPLNTEDLLAWKRAGIPESVVQQLLAPSGSEIPTAPRSPAHRPSGT